MKQNLDGNQDVVRRAAAVYLIRRHLTHSKSEQDLKILTSLYHSQQA